MIRYEGIFHYNVRLPHQQDHAEAFKACGFDHTPSPFVEMPGVHVISGPHFAYKKWKDYPQTLMIDRAWWGDPEYVSLGWLQSDGSRKFASGDTPRPVPEMADWKDGDQTAIILADYQQDTTAIEVLARARFETVTVRQHPADQKTDEPLLDAIGRHNVCIGHSGTAIFEAIKMGVPTICTDPLNECAPVCSSWVNGEPYRGDRSAWLHDMSYKQFSLTEIGLAWSLLKGIQ